MIFLFHSYFFQHKMARLLDTVNFLQSVEYSNDSYPFNIFFLKEIGCLINVIVVFYQASLEVCMVDSQQFLSFLEVGI